MSTDARWRPLAGGVLLILAGTAEVAGQEPPAAVVPYCPRHAVFRPAFDIPTRRPLMETGFEYPTKPLFLRGYAGNLYGRGPREAYLPTGFGTGTIQPVGSAVPAPAAGPRFVRRRLHHP
jgi:hypothetical protein